MTGSRLRLLVFLLGWVLCGVILWRGAYVATPVTYVALTGASQSLWIGSFYSHDNRNRLSFGPNEGASGAGNFTLEREGASITAIGSVDHNGAAYAAYRAKAGDRACIASQCQTLAFESIIASRSTGGTVEWSNSTVTMRAHQAPYPGLVRVEGAVGGTILAVAGDRLLPFSIDPDGRATLDLASSGSLSPTRVTFVVAFALIGALLIAFLPWRRLLHYLARERMFVAATALVLGAQYVALYPGLFNSDLPLAWANSDGYTTWYSSAYMAYIYLFVLIGFQWLQAPPLLIAFASLCIIQNATVIAAPRHRGIVSVALVLALLLNPYLFAVIFAGQRYFVAAALALLGLSLLFASLRAARQGKLRSYFVATGILALAALMRSEYWVLWALALAYIGTVFLRRGNRLVPIGTSVVLVGVAYGLFNVVIPACFGVDSAGDAAQYKLASLVDFARPYTCAGDHELIRVLGAFGPVEELCQGSSEDFFWKHVSPADRNLQLDSGKPLAELLARNVLRDPLPEWERIVARTKDTLFGPTWQIFDKYVYQADRATWTPHTATADAMNIMWDTPATRSAGEALVGLMQRTGDPRLGVLPGIVIALSIFGLVGWRKLPLAALTSLSVVAISLVAIALSPVANWAYLVIAPTWAMIAIPCAIIERDGLIRKTGR